MEASTLAAAVPPATNQQAEDPPDAGQDERSHLELQRLMHLADRYAHQLVADAESPSGVLLLVHGINLEVVVLDDPDTDVPALPRLLARRRPSSVAVVVAAEGALRGADGDVILVVGEISDGHRDERRFRLRACGRTRRLTRLPDHAAMEEPCVVPRLFPPQAAPTS